MVKTEKRTLLLVALLGLVGALILSAILLCTAARKSRAMTASAEYSQSGFETAFAGLSGTTSGMFSGDVKKAELRYHEEAQRDNDGKIVRKYMSYEAVVQDESGFETSCPLNCVRKSDKAIVENYIRRLKFEAKKKQETA